MKILLLASLLGFIIPFQQSYSFEKTEIDQIMQEIKSPTRIDQPPSHPPHHEQLVHTPPSLPHQDLTTLSPLNNILLLTMIYSIAVSDPTLKSLPTNMKHLHHKKSRFFDYRVEKPPYTPPKHYTKKYFKH